jgi:hypothetical protein
MERITPVLTSPLEGEVAASLWTRRVGGKVLEDAEALTPHPLASLATSSSRGEVKEKPEPDLVY